MPAYEILTRERHANLRVIPGPRAVFGNDVGLVSVVPREFAALVTYFPMVIRKNGQTGQFEPGALLGLKVDENLYLDGDNWLAPYTPLEFVRQPFKYATGDDGEAALVIDRESPRVSNAEGERLFLAAGHRSDYLEMIRSVMNELAAGTEAAHAFTAALAAHDLIVPMPLTLDVAGHPFTLDGLYTVDRARLQAVPSDDVAELHARGYLELAHYQQASLGHIRELVRRKARRLAQAG